VRSKNVSFGRKQRRNRDAYTATARTHAEARDAYIHEHVLLFPQKLNVYLADEVEAEHEDYEPEPAGDAEENRSHRRVLPHGHGRSWCQRCQQLHAAVMRVTHADVVVE